MASRATNDKSSNVKSYDVGSSLPTKTIESISSNLLSNSFGDDID